MFVLKQNLDWMDRMQMHSFGSVYSNHIILWVYQFHCIIRIHASDPYSHTRVSGFPNMVPDDTADNWISKNVSPVTPNTMTHCQRNKSSLCCSSTLNIILDDINVQISQFTYNKIGDSLAILHVGNYRQSVTLEVISTI